MHLQPQIVLESLTAQTPFAEVFKHKLACVELYQPVGQDLQQPHAHDELYVIVSGSGVFNNNGTCHSFKAGDLIFVAKNTEHRFEKFSDDFAIWVIFLLD